MTVGCGSANASRCAKPFAAASASATMTAKTGTRRISIEFIAGRSLRDANRSCTDRRPGVVFSANRDSSEAAEHRQLPGMRQGVSDGALEQAIRRPPERFVRGQIRIERGECRKKA